MSLSLKPVYRSRQFICSPYAYDAEVGQWRVASPITRCTENDVDGAELCHITKGRQRVRKVGPVHPLWLFKCLAHKCWFTIYPPGWVPFGRRALVDLDPIGEAVLGNDNWKNSAFGAAIDEQEKQIWPETCAEILKLATMAVFSYGTRKTQIRHIQGATYIFGLDSGAERQQMARVKLGIGQQAYLEACVRARDGPGPEALGAACTGLLRNFIQPSMRLFLMMVHLGQELGFWGGCANH
jgi:hypothetical protein